MPRTIRSVLQQLRFGRRCCGNDDRNSAKLAIAAKRFDAPSLTFVRDHVNTIAPGSTVLICEKKGDGILLGCPLLSGVPNSSKPTDWRAVINFLLRHNVSVLLAEFAGTGLHFINVCREANVSLYVHVHGFDVSVYVSDPDGRSNYRRLFECASGIIAPSHFLAGKLAAIGCPEGKLHVSPNGVDPELFRPVQGVPFRLLSVGRL